MPLDPKRVQAIFLEAVNHQDSADRRAVLDAECSSDAELRRRVEALLRAHDEFSSFLSDPVVINADSSAGDTVPTDVLPDRGAAK